jgi:hypothetical protein
VSNGLHAILELRPLKTLDKGYEGLLVGKAIVMAIEYKNFINGESKDIE